MRIARLSPCLVIAILIADTGLCQSEDKYTDENRPYKFGFNIQGYQHRKEEKDEKGIIKGEYGFITADGYYRVTVYATDENGDFRILSMKNYYVGFPPEDPTTTPLPPSIRGKQPEPLLRTGFGGAGGGGTGGTSRGVTGGGGGSARPGPAAPAAVSRADQPQGKEPIELQGLRACSNCLIPTTKKPESQNFRGSSFGGQGNQSPRSRPPSAGGRVGTQFSGPVTGGASPDRPPQNGFTGNNVGSTPIGGGRNQRPENQFVGGRTGFVGGGAGGNRVGNTIGGGQSFSRVPDDRFTSNRENFGGAERNNGPSGGGGRGGFGGGGEGRPEIGRVRDGLPKGVTVDDIKALLYTFNYTVGFHGHHEDGYRNGDKQGDYFFDGRDGVERKVDYIANEFGYQPNITFIDLPENDVRRPNERTEKEYGLKGYEFKWFYRK